MTPRRVSPEEEEISSADTLRFPSLGDCLDDRRLACAGGTTKPKYLVRRDAVLDVHSPLVDETNDLLACARITPNLIGASSSIENGIRSDPFEQWFQG